MQLFKFLLKKYPYRLFFVFVVSFMVGLGGGYLISFINNLIAVKVGNNYLYYLTIFISSLLFLFFLGIFSEFMALKLSLDATASFRKSIVDGVINSSLRQIELTGANRIFSSLTRDVTILVSALSNMPIFLTNLSIVIVIIGYLFYLSISLFLWTMFALFINAVIYLFISHKSKYEFKKGRSYEDLLFKDFISLTEGIKELKINELKEYDFLKELHDNINKQKKISLRARFFYIIGGNFNTMMIFSILGILIFMSSGGERIELISATVAIIYVMGPLNGLLHMYPLYMDGYASFISLKNLEFDNILQNNVEKMVTKNIPLDWEYIYFQNVYFSYNEKKKIEIGDGFSIGPLNFSLKRGCITFIVGGNGCGKTTLMKLLTRLYFPTSGSILLDDMILEKENEVFYKNKFSITFSDYHIFNKYPLLEDKNEMAGSLLERFGLNNKVNFQNGFVTYSGLSQGQMKRLALVLAILEDKEIIVLDEWAAEQDPNFRSDFYDSIIPELKAKGKTIVVVTHDDRYFYVADNIIKLECGQIVL
ncbi:cyclic peptide export ABC transporter [Photorhabdus khanii]|uniref:Cyclic peptide export ABC transporter n=1 Tax=Photorhabdus khanii TaxID=1004150 RepID=A0A7C9GM56_9GAMM|nr:cyclic peptide export ABC transporter [Photorhabdus khanii]MQL50676.1 cyclic peptide export ABC transporter [Photorhabdus khanii]